MGEARKTCIYALDEAAGWDYKPCQVFASMDNCQVHPCVAQSLRAELAAHMEGTGCAALKHLLIA